MLIKITFRLFKTSFPLPNSTGTILTLAGCLISWKICWSLSHLETLTASDGIFFFLCFYCQLFIVSPLHRFNLPSDSTLIPVPWQLDLYICVVSKLSHVIQLCCPWYLQQTFIPGWRVHSTNTVESEPFSMASQVTFPGSTYLVSHLMSHHLPWSLTTEAIW